MNDKAKPVTVQLTVDERDLLQAGLTEWGGPARATEALAGVMGFDSREAIATEGKRLASAIRDSQPLSPVDWTRALVATEISFASDVYGAGTDWVATTRFNDENAIRILRVVQRKLARAGVVVRPDRSR